MAWWGSTWDAQIRAGTTADERTLDYIFHARQIRKDVDIVLWLASRFHANICVLQGGTVAVRRPRCAPRGVFARSVSQHDDVGRTRVVVYGVLTVFGRVCEVWWCVVE